MSISPAGLPHPAQWAPSSDTHSAGSLCVDLDGTLIATDTLWESLLLLVKHHPRVALRAPFWLLRGRAYLKRRIALCVRPNAATLPYRSDVLDFVREAHRRGRHVVLATASDHQVATEVAGHLGCFSGVLASDGTSNLAESRKSDALVRRFGFGEFDYIGDSRADLASFASANRALLVDPSPLLLRKVRAVAKVHHIFAAPKRRWTTVLRALRVQQWIKNVLVFVPLVMAHKIQDGPRLVAASVLFIVFSLLASGVYVANDLLDLEADRQHPRKKHRPFAAGALSIPAGVALSAGLVCGALTVSALTFPAQIVACIAAYAGLAAAYSYRLKRIVVADVIVLASLYVVRIVAGALAVSVPLSHWLVGFSMFIFLSLALMKRHAELTLLDRGGRTDAAGRGYQTQDREWLGSAGIASGYLSVVVLALYVTSKDVEVLYRSPTILWPVCVAVLFWITSMWALAHRGSIDDDPLVVTLKDPVSQAIGALVAVLTCVAAWV
jgi:4-hydroxybenzoate polyprenyltransferase/phosphoserine phosphatase